MNTKSLRQSTAEPVVILPGLLCDSRMFTGQVEAFQAIVLDGFYGGADRVTAMAEWVIGRLPTRCALLGHSLGGRVALEVWRLAPDRIARLALADTGVHPPRAGEADARYRLLEVGRSQGAAALVDQWLGPMIGAGYRDDQHLFASLRAMAIDAGVETFEAQIEALLNRPDASPVLPTISCPFAVIVGEDDNWSPVAQHVPIVESVADGVLLVVEGAGHMAPAEDPVRFNAAMRHWLALERPAASA